MKAILLVTLLTLSTSVAAQETIEELDLVQSDVLRDFLSSRPDYAFAPESRFFDGGMREYLEETGQDVSDLSPHYASGDFNGDSLPDFAVLVLHENEERETNGSMSIVVFTLSESGSYSNVVIDDVANASGGYSIMSWEDSLCAGEWESEIYCLAPIGDTYEWDSSDLY